jgi:hypothetical protein
MTRQNPLEQLDLKNMPIRQAYQKLDSLNKTLGREKVEALKYELLLPFRRKNAMLGLGLVVMVGGICNIFELLKLVAYSMYKATPASFPDISPLEREKLLNESK